MPTSRNDAKAMQELELAGTVRNQNLYCILHFEVLRNVAQHML